MKSPKKSHSTAIFSNCIEVQFRTDEMILMMR